MFDENRSGLNQVQNVLVDGGYTKPFATAVQSRWRRGGSGETHHTFVVPKAMGAPVFRLAGKVPPTLEEL